MLLCLSEPWLMRTDGAVVIVQHDSHSCVRQLWGVFVWSHVVDVCLCEVTWWLCLCEVRASDKRITCDEEFSDSEDEGDGGRRHQESFKHKRIRLDDKPDGKTAPVDKSVYCINSLHCHTRLCTVHTTTTVLRPFFRDHPGEPVPEENFWTLWCKGRLTEADTPTILLGATPSGLTSAHLHHPPYFLWAGCHSCHPTKSVKSTEGNSVCTVHRSVNFRS